MPDHPADLLPYIGDDPAELLGVARRLSDARTGLARAGDTLFDARTQLSTAWVGTSAAVADGQIRLVGSAAERAALRLDADHRALLCCADELTGVRAAIDDLRRRWPTDWIVPVAVNPAAEQTRADVLLDWAAQAERADSATQACRRRLTASITAGAEDGEGLGSALELDGLVADDAFRATDPVAQFAALGAAAQLLVASSAGAFPPPTATSPAGMAAAWTQSSAVQQEALIQLRPGLVGALDGLPTLVRDRANRILLAGGIEDREQMLATAAASGNTALVAELERQLTGMVALQNQLGQQDVGGVPTPVYLMSFDNIQVDRVAVAVGNPDTAATVGVFVPGTGNDLGSVPGNVGRAADLLTQTRGAGAADSAVVMWLGYDAPDGLQQAAEDTAADAGAEPFAEFVSGLRAAHPGEPASVTAVLHSYAALLGAQAAARYPLELDQMVLVGATGTDLPSVTDMQIAGVPAEAVGSRVVALTMATDPILYSGAVHPGMPQDPSFGAQSIVLPGPPLDVGDIAASIVTDGVMASVPGLGVIVGPAPAVWDAEAHSAYFTDPAAMALLGQLIARRFP